MAKEEIGNQEILMCPPTYFAVEYKINPSMTSQVNRKKTEAQWLALKTALEKLKMRISLIAPIKHLPDLVFTADQGALYDHIFIKSNFRFKQRQSESDYVLEWFREKEFVIVELPKSAYFEGQGDFILFKDNILLGIGQRTNLKAAKIIKSLLNKKTITLKLINPYFNHLDTALCVLPDDTIIFYKKAFDMESVKKIEKLSPNYISISKSDAYKLACNAVVYKNNIVVNKGLSKKLIRILRKHKLSVIEVPLSEFLKSGGGAHCLIWNGIVN